MTLAVDVRGGTMIVGAIDPGLDRVSLAVFSYTVTALNKWRFAGPVDKCRQFIGVFNVKTSPAMELPERLEVVARGVHRLLNEHKVQRLYIERPAIAGTYTRHKAAAYGNTEAADSKFQRSLMMTHYASGAIIASARTVLGNGVVMIPAQRGKKEQRLEHVRMCLIGAKIREKVRNGDDLDAIGIGLGAEWPG